MSTGEISRQIVSRAEEVSGKPVLVTPDPSLKLIASVKLARGNAPAHVIHFNPHAANSDYAVAFQCGFIIRTFSIPANDRFDVGSSFRGRKEAGNLVNDHFRRSGSFTLPREVRDKLAEQMFDGLIRQLRSVPVGLRVDQWLDREYPDLRDQQRSMIERQLSDNLATLKPEVKGMAPAMIYKASVSMNAAFAAYWARHWNETPHIAAFRASGYLEAGEGLLAKWDQVPHDPSHDRELIASWGESTGVAGWYEFVPLQS